MAFLNDELRETVVVVDASVIVVEEVLERVEHVVDEEIGRPRKRKRESGDENASCNVPFRRPNKRRRLNLAEKAMENYGLGFHV